MKSSFRYIVLSSLSLSLLAGCNDSSKNDNPAAPPSPPVSGTETTILYGPESKGLFQPQVIDSDGQRENIDSDGNVSLGNISTSSIDDDDQGILRVNIRGGKPATFMTKSSSGQGVDIAGSIFQNGVYQFDLRVHDKAFTDNRVKLYAAETYELDSAPAVDITSAINAIAGSGFHTINIPASCFEDQGMDFSQSMIPFALSSESNLSFDIGNIKLIPFSTDVNPTLDCTSNSETLTGKSSDIYQRWQAPNGNYVRTGWGNNPSFTHPASDHYPTEGGIGAKYPDADYGENGGLTLNIKSGEDTKDISRFIETGILSFDLKVTNFSSHSGDMEVRKGTGNNDESQMFLITDLVEGEETRVSIPLKKLFQLEANKLNTYAIQNIDRPLIIQPAMVTGNETLQGFEFVVNNVSLEMIPSAGLCIPK